MSNVTIISCHFISNEATGKGIDKNSLFYGGSAVFLSAKNSIIANCSFKQNYGGKSAFKIFHYFPESSKKLEILNKLSLENDKKLISIIDCFFESNKESFNFINYFVGKDGSEIEIKNCNFKGLSNKKTGFINGKQFNNDKTKVHIIECSFEYETKSNIEKAIFYLKLISFASLFAATLAFLVIYSTRWFNYHNQNADDLEIIHSNLL